MRRFTIAPDRIARGRVTFDSDESRHLTAVLRLRPGDTVLAADGAGREYTVRLDAVGTQATGTVVGVGAGSGESPISIVLVQSVPKGHKMDVIVRAATELGVARVVPVIAERTIVRLDPPRWRERARRWQRIAQEAAKQCGRAVVPPVEPPRPLEEWAAADERADLRLCVWERAGDVEGGSGDAPPGMPLARALPDALGPTPDVAGGTRVSVVIVVGPEGGLSVSEVSALAARGYAIVGLGPRVLRTETAGPAVVAIVQARYGGLGG